jgi:hypothetical protein
MFALQNSNYQNVITKKLLNKNEGQLAASLVKDFLEKCELDYTLSVYEPELNSVIFSQHGFRFLLTISNKSQLQDVSFAEQGLAYKRVENYANRFE